MKYSYNLLLSILPDIKNYPVRQLTEVLSSKLAEVESVEFLGDRLKGLLVAKIVDKKKHPNSNKLYIVKVDIGNKIAQVVAGAGNMKVGDFVPYTPVNTRVPRNAYPQRFDGIVRKIKLAGEISEGMLNSEFELGISNDHSKILILNELQNNGINLQAGMPLYKALYYDDYLIEIENKALTHRGDVFSHIGLAREIKAMFNLDKELEISKVFSNLASFVQNFETDNGSVNLIDKNVEESNKNINPTIKLGNIDKDCWQYNLYKLKIKNVQESPLWLKLQLSKFEVGIVSYLVDLLNFVTLIIGQPMHAFDLNKLIKNYGKDITIEVKYKKSGKLLALDSKEYKIKDSTLCITANDKPIAFAGVIGGKDTAIDKDTTDILLEIAVFSYIPIRKTMMMYGLNTMASVIYARQQSLQNINKAYKLVLTHLPVLTTSLIGEAKNKYVENKEIKIKYGDLFKFLGINVSNKEVLSILRHLGFIIRVDKRDTIEVIPPDNRLDINIPEDVYEEIIRIKGYENVKPELPLYSPIVIGDDKKVTLRHKLSLYFKAKGYIETVGYGFFSQKNVEELGFKAEGHYKIINAISPEVKFFRSSIYPQLLGRINTNLQYTTNLKIFEIGHVAHKYVKHSFDDILRYHSEQLPYESLHIAGIIASKNQDIKDLLGSIVLDVRQTGLELDIIPVYEDFADKMLTQSRYWQEMLAPFNKWNSGLVINNDKIIGIIGGLQSKINRKLGFFTNPVIFEIELDSFLNKDSNYFVKNSVKTPAVYEDYSFVVSNNISFYMFSHTLKDCKNKILADIDKNRSVTLNQELLDIFYPKSLKDLRYITLRFYFISDNRKNLEEFTNVFRNKLEACLKKKLQVELKK